MEQTRFRAFIWLQIWYVRCNYYFLRRFANLNILLFPISDETVIDLLPQQKQTQINMDIHLLALRKVRIFQACESGLLIDLVNKMTLQLFCPGDRVCSKGCIFPFLFTVSILSVVYVF